jgi:hypothetical protein
MKRILTVSLTTLGLLALSVVPTFAQSSSTSYWSQCADNTSIVRCDTYNCPKGDTNGDGLCDLKDSTASISESRNDSFCANPPSGCGQVLYYSTGTNNSCAVRVKENGNNCNLYKAGNPQFVNSTPSVSPSPTPASRLNTSPIASATPTPSGAPKTLPKTGPELWVSIFVAALGMFGLFLYETRREE